MVALHWRDQAIERLTTIVLLKDLSVSDGGNSIVIELEPSSLPIRFDESEVVTAVQITRVNQDTMKLVDPGLGPVCRVVEEFVKVNLEREFVAVVDL